jgi:hypothetical protein
MQFNTSTSYLELASSQGILYRGLHAIHIR